jgi:hypothetical protein
MPFRAVPSSLRGACASSEREACARHSEPTAGRRAEPRALRHSEPKARNLHCIAVPRSLASLGMTGEEGSAPPSASSARSALSFRLSTLRHSKPPALRHSEPTTPWHSEPSTLCHSEPKARNLQYIAVRRSLASLGMTGEEGSAPSASPARSALSFRLSTPRHSKPAALRHSKPPRVASTLSFRAARPSSFRAIHTLSFRAVGEESPIHRCAEIPRFARDDMRGISIASLRRDPSLRSG